MRRLIINADDFGLTPGINRAVEQASRAGIVTSATLMATGPKLQEAVQLASGSPKLSVGCHVVLIDGRPVSRSSEIPSLCVNDEFQTSLPSFAMRALSGGINPAEIEREAVAQIRKLQDAGITVSHLDTHKHTHVFPAVLGPLLRAARVCGIPAIRNPFVPSRPMPLATITKYPGLAKRYVQVNAMRRIWAKRFRMEAEAAGIATPDGSLGVIETGHWNAELFETMLRAIPEGTWELVCHPGYVDAELNGIQTRLRESRARELELLTSSSTRELLDRQGIELISYSDLRRPR